MDIKNLPYGTLITDDMGHQGRITKRTEWDGVIWYDVTFDRGSATRNIQDIALVEIPIGFNVVDINDNKGVIVNREPDGDGIIWYTVKFEDGSVYPRLYGEIKNFY